MHRPNYRISEIEPQPLPYPVDMWASWICVGIVATFCLVLAFAVPPKDKPQESHAIQAVK